MRRTMSHPWGHIVVPPARLIVRSTISMRFIVAGIMHETHTFSAEPTTIETLQIFRGEELLRFAGTNHSVGGTIDQCLALGIEILPAYFAVGVSTSTPSRSTFD